MEGQQEAARQLEEGDHLAPTVEVARAEGRGRLVRAAAGGVSAGETVATAEVFVWSHMPREARRLCAHCGRPLRPNSGVRCRGGCPHTFYCPPSSSSSSSSTPSLISVHQTTTAENRKDEDEDGKDLGKMEGREGGRGCEVEAQAYHAGAACRSMRRYEAAVATGVRKGTLASSLFGSQEATMLARLVISALTHPDRRRLALTMALEPNMHALSSTRLSQYQQMADVIASSISLPRGEQKKVKAEDVVRLLCIQQCNSFGLANDEGEMTGVAIYPELSLFNHSCMPNCASVDDPTGDKRRCIIKAIVPVPPGEELTISYVDLDLSRELRMDKLEESYAFRCSCPRCAASDDGDDGPDVKAYLSWITCAACSGTLIPTPPGQDELVACNSCTFVGTRRREDKHQSP